MRAAALVLALAAILAASASGAQSGVWERSSGSGAALTAPRERVPQITGGQVISPDKWPFVVPVFPTYADGTFALCTGSVIGARWVLTAAHCLIDPEPVSVDVVVGGVLQRADTWLVNEGYDPATQRNDIGAIRLPADFTGVAVRMAVESDARTFAAGGQAVIAGWGATSQDDLSPPALREAGVEIARPSACGIYPGFSPSTMLCAGLVVGIGTCNGDSGGPLLVTDGLGLPLVAGVTIFGPRDGCGSAFAPDGFTRVASYATSLVSYLTTDPVAPVGAPSVSASAATASSDRTASFQATIVPGGLATSYRVEYGPGSSLTASIGGYAGAGGPVAITANLTGLSPGTAYSYRVVAVSAAGAAAGPTGTFTTSGAAQPAGDAVAPVVRALTSSGRAGGSVQLRYRVFDETSQQTRERIVVRRSSGQRVATLRTRYARSQRGQVYYYDWRVRRTLVGVLRFCVESEDRAGNRSAPSCARLKLRPPV